MKTKTVMAIIKKIEPGIFVSDPTVAEGRIQAIINSHSEEEIMAFGIVALMKASRRNGTGLAK